MLSIFDIFTIGIGPSSSHTVGPMRAGKLFAEELPGAVPPDKIAGLTVEFFGSLGLTGRGHGSDRAVMLGLIGETPEGVEPDAIAGLLKKIRDAGEIILSGGTAVSWDEKRDIIFHRDVTLAAHSNGLKFSARNAGGDEILARTYFSVGGGFIVGENQETPFATRPAPPHSFDSANSLLTLARGLGKKIYEIVLENEKTWRTEAAIHDAITAIWLAMQSCVERGCCTVGVLPGGLKVKRRAPEMFRRLQKNIEKSLADPLAVMDWVNLYALAVNEENAAGARVVTAPTNGAAGIIPAVLHYVERFTPHGDDAGIVKFLSTAGAIGILYKQNASISGAEVGCQGEVGVACSMAAAGLTAVLGGSNEQIENAAEIGMEHNLGLTCDPIGGLVQIPCIERNAMGAVKAINAARIAIAGDGTHKVSLDKVIKTMLDTGRDMQTKYKETSEGGLAANVVEC